ncbi:hypothetical protein F2Q70_00040891 [Brassica cretica]|uniref:LisH domain-containing protein n=2 Tax=Magnoliopsida TaxID=3398 RepID=A0A8S9KCY4_BRACR|nr:hypothetical protein F2Q70_00040891 [Brassica cretica]
MRSLLAFRKIPPPFLLRWLIHSKPFCSQSRFPKESDNPSPQANGSASDDNPPTSVVVVANLSTTKPEQKDESRVIDALLDRRNDPESALRFYNWARPGSFEVGNSFWLLIHILVSSPESHGRARDLLQRYVSSSSPMTMPKVLVTNLVESAKSFGFEVKALPFSYLLNAYTRERRTDYAVDCINLMIELGLPPYVRYVNNTLSALVRRNSINEAKELYGKMVATGLVAGDKATAHLLMRASLREEKPEEALEVFSKAIERGEEPDGLLYSLAIQACCKTVNLGMAFGLLREMKEKKKLCVSQETYTSVIVALVKQDKVEEAVRLKDEMVSDGINMNVIAATSLIKGHCKNSDLGSALEIFRKMEREGPSPNRVTFSVLMEWFSKNGDMEKFRFPKESGNPSPQANGSASDENPPTSSSSVVVVVENLSTTKPEQKDESRVIDALLDRRNDPESALRFYNWARPGSFEVGDSFWLLINILVSSPESHGRARDLLQRYVSSSSPMTMPKVLVTNLVESAKSFGFEVKALPFSYLLNAYTRERRTDYAVDCINLMIELGLPPYVRYVNNTLSALVRRNSINEAKELYGKMVATGLVAGDKATAHLLMRASLREEKPEEALEVFSEAIERGEEPDGLLYSLAIQACCKTVNLGMAFGLLREMKEKKKLCVSQETYTSVIVALVKQDKVEEAVRLKDEMVSDGINMNVIAATSLIKGHCKNGDLGSALEIFRKMEREGPSPNSVTFSVLIEWFSKNGDMERVLEFYKKMEALGSASCFEMDDYTREMMDLKTLVTRTLEKKGVLAKIRAELRASVFEAIEEEDRVIQNSQGLPPALLGNCNDRARRLHASPSGRLLSALVCEYLNWAQLNHTLKVYQPECNLAKDSWKSELRDFSSNSGYELNRNGDSKPLLLDVLDGFFKFEVLSFLSFSSL